MSRFSEAMAQSAGAIDETFGDLLAFIPWKAGNYSTAGGPDPARQARTMIGTLTGTMDMMKSSGDTASFRGADMPANVPIASFLASLFASENDWPKENDRIIAVDLPGQPVFIVSFSESDDMSRVYCRLTKAA